MVAAFYFYELNWAFYILANFEVPINLMLETCYCVGLFAKICFLFLSSVI
jgi:hypothetical protein